MALAKGKKRVLCYGLILGGLAVLSLTFFTISQFEKAKCVASEAMTLNCKRELTDVVNQYKKDQGIPKTDDIDMDAFLADTENYLNPAAVYWNANYVHFQKVSAANSAARQGTAIPAYLFSMSTLVAFGLILKHAEKAKEKEDEEAVRR